MERIQDAELYLGDCLEILPTLGRVDAVISDPPFGVWFKYNSHVDDAHAYPDFMRRVVSVCGDAVGDGLVAFWQGMPNCDRWHEWFPKGFRIFAACKGFVQYRPTPVQFSWDPIVFWGKPNVEPTAGRRDWHAQMITPFGAGREKVDHPCPRPIEQVRMVIETFTSPGDLVLDPFMGSGTTGIACANLGRRFVGIEIDEKYFDVALKRISEAKRQTDIFTAKPAEQTKLFGGDAA